MLKKLMVIFAALAMVASACGSDGDDASSEPSADVTTTAAPAETTAAPVENTSDSSDAIKIPIHNWSSQIAGAYVLGAILESTGNSVEYISADSTLVYTSMCEGDMDIVHEVWQGAFGPAFEPRVEEGCVIDAGTHDALTREEWWYPSYVEDVCPGLPDWEALNDCSDLFTTPDSGGKGRFLGGPADWLKGDQERVDGLGMNFIVENAGTAGALWAALDAASANQEPIVLFNWTPNFVDAVYDGKFIEFPEYHDDCKTDASWGLNPETTHDCGNPAAGYLKTGVNVDFPDKWPTAYATVQKINFTSPDLNNLAAYIDIDGMEPEDAAERWLAENCDRWTGWSGADASVCPAAPDAPAEEPVSDTPGEGVDVKMARANWSTGYFQASIVAQLLGELGYNVSDPADTELPPSNFFTALGEGEVDLWANSWYPGHRSWWENEMTDGSLVGDHVSVVGELLMSAGVEGLLVTKTVAEEHGIKTIDQIDDDPDLIALFDANDTNPGDGIVQILGCPEDWTCDDIINAWIATAGWENIEQTKAGYDAMIAEGMAKVAAGEPTINYTWAPSGYVAQLVPGDNVMWLSGIGENTNDDSINEAYSSRDANGDPVSANHPEGVCTNDPCYMGWKPADIQVSANNDFLAANPAAEALLAQIVLSSLDVALMNLEYGNSDQTEATVKAIGAAWIAENRDTVDGWLDAARAAG